MSNKFALPCPDCQATLEVGVPQAGQEVVCDACGTTFQAPRLGQLKQLPTVGTTAPVGQRATDRTKSGIFVVGLLLAVAGIGGGLALYFYAKSLIVDYNVEAAMDRIDEEYVDTLDAFEVVSYYKQMNIDTGLGEWQEQPHVESTKRGEILRVGAYVLMGLGGIGVIMMLFGLRA